jgi:hypothetical protein
MNSKTSYNRESGNVLIYILIAVALVAALSFAVASSWRGNVNILGDEKGKLSSATLLAFGDTVEKAIAQLRLRGTSLSGLRFASPFLTAADYGTYGAAPQDEIFNTDGGAVNYKDPPPETTVSGTEKYQFLGGTAVAGVGSTCTDDSCSDLLLAVANVQEAVCININDTLHVGAQDAAPPEESGIDFTGKFKGVFTYVKTLGGAGDTLFAKPEGCFKDNGLSQYVYYKVLIPR